MLGVPVETHPNGLHQGHAEPPDSNILFECIPRRSLGGSVGIQNSLDIITIGQAHAGKKQTRTP